MKKILFMLFLLFIPIINCKAITTYYSDYEDYLIGSEELLDESDLIKRDEYKVYNTGIRTITDQGYVKSDVCINKYEGDTKVDFILSNVEVDDSNIYQSFNIYDKTINTIVLYSTGVNSIKEVEVFDGDKKLEIGVQSSRGDPSLLNDGKNQDYIIFQKEDLVNIVLDNTETNNLKIHIDENSPFNGVITFVFTDGTQRSIKVFANYFDVVDDDKYAEIKSYVSLTSDGDAFAYYKKYITLYHCYDETNIVLNEYKRSVSALNEYLIEDDYKILYDYQKRDKVKISDKKITSRNFDLKSLVSESSIDIDQIQVVGEVDFYKNGTYPVSFIMNDKFIVNKDVVINVSSNNTVPTTTTSIKENTTHISTSSKTTSTVKTTTKAITPTKVDSITTSNINKTVVNKELENIIKEDVTTSNVTTSGTTQKIETTKTSNRVASTRTSTSTSTTSNVSNKIAAITTSRIEEEPIVVEPLKGVLDTTCKTDNKSNVLIILLFLIIILLVSYIILLHVANKKETC